MPPILTERTIWKKPRPQNETRRSFDLTPEEHENARAALRFLMKRLGSRAKLAKATGVNLAMIERATGTRGKPSAGLALRASRLAGVSVEDVLSGAWPPAGACPHCGRG